MRRLLTLCVLLATASPALAAAPATAPAVPCDVTVDGRVELVCVLMRLAGNREYNMGRVTSYERDVRAHFAPFRDHEAVRLADDYAAGYDAPMSLAVHLTPLPDLGERAPFDPHPVGLDRRLQFASTRRLLAAARRFAADAKFDEFLASHEDLYATAAERMTRTLAEHARLDWFPLYFHGAAAPAENGADVAIRRPAQFHLLLGLQNGPCNYAARVIAPDADHFYCVIGAWDEDADGLPRFGKSVVPTIIHEFGHCYVNPVVDRHLDALHDAGQKLFDRNAAAMRAQAYRQWDTMMRESVLRACVVRYRLAHDSPLAAAGEIAEQTLRGFTWTAALATRLAEYEANRDRYPTFDSFMPRVVDFFNEYAASLK